MSKMPLDLMNWEKEKAWCLRQHDSSVPVSESSTACQRDISGTCRWGLGLGPALLCGSDRGESGQQISLGHSRR